MAVYIDDAGGYGFDALFVGVEDTAWSRSTTDECVWFSSTGTCETGFTLPDTEWIVYEVYGMTGVTADYTTLSGSTQLHGKKEYTTTIGTVLTTINAWRTAFNSGKGADYTTYELIVTHYKGSSLVDIYEADETTAFSTATHEDAGFTTGSAWTLSDDLLASSAVTSAVYGIEEITVGDPTFTSSTNWTTTGTPTIAGGVLTLTSYGDGVYSSENLDPNETYRTWITVDSVTTDGRIKVNLGGYDGNFIVTNGTGLYYVDINMSSSLENGRFYITTEGFSGDITLVSCKKLVSGEQLSANVITDSGFDNGTTNWTLGSGWTISTSALHIDGTTATTAVSDSIGTLTLNDIYKCTIVCSSHTADHMQLYIGNSRFIEFNIDDETTPASTHTFYLTSHVTTLSNLTIKGNGTAPEFSLSSFTMQKVLT